MDDLAGPPVGTDSALRLRTAQRRMRCCRAWTSCVGEPRAVVLVETSGPALRRTEDAERIAGAQAGKGQRAPNAW